jgi:hypothetical protein
LTTLRSLTATLDADLTHSAVEVIATLTRDAGEAFTDRTIRAVVIFEAARALETNALVTDTTLTTITILSTLWRATDPVYATTALAITVT